MAATCRGALGTNEASSQQSAPLVPLYSGTPQRYCSMALKLLLPNGPAAYVAAAWSHPPGVPEQRQGESMRRRLGASHPPCAPRRSPAIAAGRQVPPPAQALPGLRGCADGLRRCHSRADSAARHRPAADGNLRHRCPLSAESAGAGSAWRTADRATWASGESRHHRPAQPAP